MTNIVDLINGQNRTAGGGDGTIATLWRGQIFDGDDAHVRVTIPRLVGDNTLVGPVPTMVRVSAGDDVLIGAIEDDRFNLVVIAQLAPSLGRAITWADLPGRLPQTQLPMATRLDSTMNLNNVTSPGSYVCDADVNAKKTLNYPVDSTAGLLEVQTYNPSWVFQRYTSYQQTSNGNKLWIRSKYNSTWGAWTEK